MAFLAHDLPKSRLAMFWEHSLESLKDAAHKRKVYRTTFDELNSLSARELADLGIIRSDIARLAREAAASA